MQHGTLHDPLECRGWLDATGWILSDQARQVLINILFQRQFQRGDIDLARAHHLDRVFIIGESEQKMLERRIFVLTLAGGGQGAFKRIFKARG